MLVSPMQVGGKRKRSTTSDDVTASASPLTHRTKRRRVIAKARSKLHQDSPALRQYRALLQLPKAVASPRLAGVREMFATAAGTSSSQLSTPDLSKYKSLLKSPKTRLDSPALKLYRALLVEEIEQQSPKLFGVRELLQEQLHTASPRLAGLKELFNATNNSTSSPDVRGLRELFKVLPVANNGSPDLRGLRELLASPKMMTSPQLRGVRELLRSAKASPPSPDLSGVSEIMMDGEQLDALFEAVIQAPLQTSASASPEFKASRSKQKRGKVTASKKQESVVTKKTTRGRRGKVEEGTPDVVVIESEVEEKKAADENTQAPTNTRRKRAAIAKLRDVVPESPAAALESVPKKQSTRASRAKSAKTTEEEEGDFKNAELETKDSPKKTTKRGRATRVVVAKKTIQSPKLSPAKPAATRRGRRRQTHLEEEPPVESSEKPSTHNAEKEPTKPVKEPMKPKRGQKRNVPETASEEVHVIEEVKPARRGRVAKPATDEVVKPVEGRSRRGRKQVVEEPTAVAEVQESSSAPVAVEPPATKRRVRGKAAAKSPVKAAAEELPEKKMRSSRTARGEGVSAATGAKTVHFEASEETITDVKRSKAQKKTREKKTAESANAEPDVHPTKGIFINTTPVLQSRKCGVRVNIFGLHFTDESKPAARGSKRTTAGKAAAVSVVEAAEASESKVTKTRSRKRKADVEVVEEYVAPITEAPPKRGRKAAQKSDVKSTPEPAETKGLFAYIITHESACVCVRV